MTRQLRDSHATIARRIWGDSGRCQRGEGGRGRFIWKDRPEKILIGKGGVVLVCPLPPSREREGPAPKAWEGEGLSTAARKTLTDID
ncbi:MAG: hypothetical protein A3H25_07870 [Sphingomonadales bacterium RIFCSPLOWO2_12_FULL_63_15]|nr:MAG: hypothetical protein A3H25_07870 [Sphingomonadales bacterium RIFCSPLOWO2_12_FULL_63_15]